MAARPSNSRLAAAPTTTVTTRSTTCAASRATRAWLRLENRSGREDLNHRTHFARPQGYAESRSPSQTASPLGLARRRTAPASRRRTTWDDLPRTLRPRPGVSTAQRVLRPRRSLRLPDIRRTLRGYDDLHVGEGAIGALARSVQLQGCSGWWRRADAAARLRAPGPSPDPTGGASPLYRLASREALVRRRNAWSNYRVGSECVVVKGGDCAPGFG